MNYKVIAEEGIKLPYMYLRNDTIFDSNKVVADIEYLEQLVSEGKIVIASDNDNAKSETLAGSKDKEKSK